MVSKLHKTKRCAVRLFGLLAAGFPFLMGCETSHRTDIVLNSDQIPAAAAHAPSAPVSPVTAEQAVQRALACNRQIVSMRAAVEIAIQRRGAATDIKDPEFEYDWGRNSNNGFDDSQTTSNHGNKAETRARVFVPNPWLVVPDVDARTADLRAAKADLQAASWLVTCDVRRLCAEINYLDSDMALATKLVRLNSVILNAVRSRAEQGAATLTDMASASRRNLQIQNDLDQIRQRYKLAQRELAALLDMPLESLPIATNMPAFPSLPKSAIPLDQAEATALRYRGDVAALHWRTLAAGSAYREAYNVRLPWIQELKAKHQEDSGEWWLGFAINVPIFSWTKNHADDVLRAQSTLAGVNEREGRLLASREVHDAMDELEESWSQQARYDNDVAPLVAEMRRTLATLQATPNTLPDQIADTEVQIVESDRLDLAARQRYCLALINLERTVGKPLAELPQAKK